VNAEEALGDADDFGIDFDGVEVDIGMVMVEGALCAAAAEADGENAFDVGVPDPGKVKEFDVFEMAGEGVAEGHAGFLGTVEAEDADAALVDDSDVVIGGESFVDDGSVCGEDWEKGRDEKPRGGACVEESLLQWMDEA
jgi:hypothetical protein